MATPPRSRLVVAAIVALALLALPPLMNAVGAGYYLSTAGKIVVFAIAATSLNLVLGYGGMVSFGHAAFFGLGAYATGVLISEGVLNGGVHLLATVAVTALAALVIGAISLRTRGVYFIMITLAFGQMLFYLANSIKGYGGDEGPEHPRPLDPRLRSRPEGHDDLLLRRPRRARGDAARPARLHGLEVRSRHRRDARR